MGADGRRAADELTSMTWGEVDDRAASLLVVPIGSCEQHGPHLPLDTDSRIAVALARDLAARRGDCIIAPPLAVTASGEHQGFPGTLSIGAEVTTALVIELVRSADWAEGIVLVNGHGGNRASIDAATDQLDREGRRVLAWWPVVPGGDPHAGRVETSIVLALDPEAVRLDAAVAGPVPPLDELVRHGVRALSASGVLGDPAGANAGEGRALLADLADDLATRVDAWSERWRARR